ncbi:Lrp/AsnC family transcriptional regulator [Paraburkholderia phenoliruptrix]|uniref:Lrp/AsnC family transcriptional regulator n=1 Tax=Paraburkholderia phenoliruptrix TaxID=252970 RepID=UPI002869A82A|nr:Lrp/AsnC family transcriptional regulator [Paraburkholderia phenoliruptrix]WMY11011.1 Lrp/AsnC family transcriptional regulator [Paraburkholderia phenoliruptrix]
MTHLDKIDAAILTRIQKNCRLTSEELGEQVNLSPSACQRRLKRLRSEGIVEAEVAIVSTKALGRAITMVALVSLERERADIVDRFKNSIRATPEVMMGFYATGDADFVLVLTAKSMEDYEQFTRRFFYQNADIKGIKTMVVLDRVKASFEFPIDTDDPMFGFASDS